jgi:4-hydroxythreonine-4-phosphate dehydrogenase
MEIRKKLDIVVAEYKDQRQIPIKLLDFWSGVNISLGLPIICTSVGHGATFDMTVEGDVNPTNLINAIQYASRMHPSCSNVRSSTGS